MYIEFMIHTQNVFKTPLKYEGKGFINELTLTMISGLSIFVNL